MHKDDVNYLSYKLYFNGWLPCDLHAQDQRDFPSNSNRWLQKAAILPVLRFATRRRWSSMTAMGWSVKYEPRFLGLRSVLVRKACNWGRLHKRQRPPHRTQLEERYRAHWYRSTCYRRIQEKECSHHCIPSNLRRRQVGKHRRRKKRAEESFWWPPVNKLDHIITTENLVCIRSETNILMRLK